MAKKLFIFIFLLLVLTPALMYLLWFFKPEQKLNVLILDKTVLTNSAQEHISLTWILNQEKYIHSDYGKYDPRINYFGFFPDENGNYHINDLEQFNKNQLDSLSELYDVAYYTDLYGIYSNEWNAIYHPQKINNNRYISQRSECYYGGLTNTELNFLKLMKTKNKLIINEFNTIASPTSTSIRKQYEQEFGIQWSGWVGRFYDNLDTLVNLDIPRWMIDNYKKNNQQKWPFKQSGIVFVREDDKVIILENKIHLKIEVPYILTNKSNAEEYDLTPKIKYPFWFDIIKTDTTLQTISEFEIVPTILGDSIMHAWNIPTKFPAVVFKENTYSYYYMAGDFCDNPLTMKSSYFRHIHLFSFFTVSNEITERNSFFWKYYRPLLNKILSDYTTKKETGNHK